MNRFFVTMRSRDQIRYLVLPIVFFLVGCARQNGNSMSVPDVTQKTGVVVAADATNYSPAALEGKSTGDEWSGNRLRMQFVWCEPGTFTMGSPPDEPDRGADEEQVEVELTRGFWLGKYEVTQSQWKSVMNTEPWVGQTRVLEAPDSPACWLNWEKARLFYQELTRHFPK